MNDKEKPFGWIGYLTVFIAVFFVIGIGIVYVNLSSLKSDNEALTASLSDRYGDYAKMDDNDVTVEQVQLLMHSASEKGTMIADSINDAWDLVDHSRKDLGYSAVLADAKEILHNIVGCFPDVYDNGNTWYHHYDEETGDYSHWEFMTTHSFSGHKVNCVWLCRRHSDNRILAYVTSVYDSDTDMFGSYTHRMTVYGREWIADEAN